MINKEDFYLLERKPSTLPDDNRRVVVVAEGKNKGLCPGSGIWITDVLFPNGNTIKSFTLEIQKERKGDEIVILSKEGIYDREALDDNKLSDFRFYMHLSKD